MNRPADVLLRRQQNRAQTRAMSRQRSFKRQRVNTTIDAKRDWILRVQNWLSAFGEVFDRNNAKRRFMRRRDQLRKQHQARLERDPKYAARCEKRRDNWLSGLDNDWARSNRLTRQHAREVAAAF